jgi:hypothetical protein
MNEVGIPERKLKPMQRPSTPPIWLTKSTQVILYTPKKIHEANRLGLLPNLLQKMAIKLTMWLFRTYTKN